MVSQTTTIDNPSRVRKWSERLSIEKKGEEVEDADDECNKASAMGEIIGNSVDWSNK